MTYTIMTGRKMEKLSLWEGVEAWSPIYPLLAPAYLSDLRGSRGRTRKKARRDLTEIRPGDKFHRQNTRGVLKKVGGGRA